MEPENEYLDGDGTRNSWVFPSNLKSVPKKQPCKDVNGRPDPPLHLEKEPITSIKPAPSSFADGLIWGLLQLRRTLGPLKSDSEASN